MSRLVINPFESRITKTSMIPLAFVDEKSVPEPIIIPYSIQIFYEDKIFHEKFPLLLFH